MAAYNSYSSNNTNNKVKSQLTNDASHRNQDKYAWKIETKK